MSLRNTTIFSISISIISIISPCAGSDNAFLDVR